MKKTKQLMLLMLMPLLALAQMQTDNKGIQWTTGLTWEQVKRKAKQENKYIFMDCYATWCGPCKAMDKETYPDEKVGELMNEKFIAVKVQIDSTKDDPEPIQKWYPVVKEIKAKYTIPGYPAYLFFSPEGELVHEDVGFKPVKNFVALVNDALDPSTQFAKVMEQYEAGQRDPAFVVRAIKAAKNLGHKELADSLARSYKSEYLNKLDDASLFTKINIQFVAQDFVFLIYEEGSKGRFFDFFYHHPEKVDSLFFNGFADFYVKHIIATEELSDKLFLKSKAITETPDWESLKQNIAIKYKNDYAQKLIEEYQPFFYQKIGNWQKWADLFEEKIKKYPPQKGAKNFGGFGDDRILNDNAWTLFQNCNDRTVLSQALKWSELAIKLKGSDRGIDGYLDTKANLLYKLGKRNQAIKTEKKALQLNNKIAQKEGREKGVFFDEFTGNIQKMEAGIPTWKRK